MLRISISLILFPEREEGKISGKAAGWNGNGLYIEKMFDLGKQLYVITNVWLREDSGGEWLVWSVLLRNL